MTSRERYSSGAPWEPVVGYSRAVRVGDRILVAGTTAVDETGTIQGKGAFDQATYIFEKCLSAVEAMGGSAEHVVLTRMYVVDVGANGHEVARAHRQSFEDTLPVATMVGVSALVDPQLIVEVEMEAVV